MTKENILLTVLITLCSLFFGKSNNTILIILMICVIFDYVSGVIQSFINKTTNSQKGFRGILKKILILIIISMSHFLDIVFNSNIIMSVTTSFFIANECISILENSAKCGIKYPKKLLAVLEQLKKEGE